MSVLLTSFTTWLSHQKSNSADDLLAILEQENNQHDCHFLRQLPVEIEAASQKAIASFQQIQPSALICCGMAESRSKLTIESRARYKQNCLQTIVDLAKLVSYLSHTSISDNAGRFVCEGLYYQVLHYLQLADLATPCIFVHVPVLTTDNTEIILQDFNRIIKFLTAEDGERVTLK